MCSSDLWSPPKPGSPESKQLPELQLYDLSNDIGETNNVQAAHPEVVARLKKLLEKHVANGRSTPGARQTNTTPVRVVATPAETTASLLLKTPARRRARR